MKSSKKKYAIKEKLKVLEEIKTNTIYSIAKNMELIRVK